ncbi:hypothetical protein [Campylobacter armoricus]|uniref:hypothetical protein n=1 Tax=Campylobacter armoricus TaxID=2505970 RepID=UPI001115D9BC|nr:hypothetical protein [Campylobacter armoricus]
MAEYNIVKLDGGDFNQTDNALGQAIQNHACIIFIIIIIAIFCFTLVKMFKTKNNKSVKRNSHKKRKEKS